jgi:hypothetical protein
MSATPTPAPATTAGVGSNRSLLAKLAGGTTVAALLAAGAIAFWPASETDKAYDDGQRFGEAVAQLQSAQSTEEVDAALTEMDAAVADTRDHAGDAVADQVADQDDALSRAADGFVGTHTSDDAFEVDLYQSELNTAVDDLESNAEHFRTTGPEVQQAFWDGYQDGLNG